MNKRIVGLILTCIMLMSVSTIVSAETTILPAPQIVTLTGENNELFTVIGEADEFYEGIRMQTIAQGRTRWASTPVDSFNTKGDVDHWGNPVELVHKYYDGYTAKDIHAMTFESTEVTEKYYQLFFGKTSANSPLVWGTNTYFNYGYIQLFHDRDEVYFACYNPSTNTLYRYPGPMSSIDDMGTALLECDDKVYKVQFKPALISVLYDGKRIGFDQVPIAENGRTLVPLRAIFEKIGATVGWDNDTQTVTATKGDTTITLTLNSTVATKNGQKITLDVPATSRNGRTLVPVRFVSDCFGVGVEWNGDIQSVILTSK